MTTTILARDLKPGDVIDFGGQPITLSEHTSAAADDAAGRVYLDWPFGGTWLPADLPLNVQRPDPDAELVEVMARAAYLDDDCPESRWPSAPVCETYRGNIRAALAAAREAGLL